MSRDQRRNTALMVLKGYHRAKRILDPDVPKFEMLIRRCRTLEDHTQVMAALHHYMEDILQATDRHALLMRNDDVFGLDGTDDRDLSP